MRVPAPKGMSFRRKREEKRDDGARLARRRENR
jgi:hypothetical protein